MSIHLPLLYDELNAKWVIKIDQGAFDVLQALIFQAEEYLHAGDLHSHTGYRMSDVVLMREEHFLDYDEKLLLSMREFELLVRVADPGMIKINSYNDPFERVLSSINKTIFEDVKAKLLQINSIVRCL